MSVRIEETTTTVVDSVTLDGFNASIEVTKDERYLAIPWKLCAFAGGSKLTTVQRQSTKDVRDFAHALLHMIGDE